MPAFRARPAKQPDPTSSSTPTGLLRTGLVIVNYGKNQLVEDTGGSLYRCVARRGLEPLVCGDAVQWQPTGRAEGVIESLLPRRTTLYRAGGSSTRRPLAANIDQIAIEAAPEPTLDAYLVDKYTAAAELARMAPLIVINKSDLVGEDERERLRPLIGEYEAIGYRVLFTSALENTGIEDFSACLTGKASILVGQSGVGKSSLVQRLMPEKDIAIGRLSEASRLGKHTTTTTTLYHLPHGGSLIDSPGVRDFHLGEVTALELQDGFREFRPFLGECRFNDCRHLGEPGCAILAAVEAGRISGRRMASYRRLLQSS
ncbi:MAG: ribosome small subunit-dependent GTPase A [Gammaproteobacteria bacterium]|jgi:ribosome biogenesis GTPase